MSARRLCEAEIAREARRIFRKLLTPGTYLKPHEGHGYVLLQHGRARRNAMRVEDEIVREFLRRDWLKPCGTDPESYRLSAAGEGWFLRVQTAVAPFAAQHQRRAERAIATAEGERCVTVNEAESPLGWLRKRHRIDAAQFEAGERLRRDYTIAQLTPRLGVDFSAPIVLGRRGMKTETSLHETVLAAKQRFRRAMAAAGPGLADMLFDVCCHLIGLEEVEYAKEWPRRSAKVVLDIALDRLVEHYGLKITGRARAPMRSWQAETAE